MSKYDMLTPEYERALLELAARHFSDYEDEDEGKRYCELIDAVEAPTRRLIGLLIKADLLRVSAEPEDLIQQLQPTVSAHDGLRRVACGWQVTDFYGDPCEVILTLGAPCVWKPLDKPALTGGGK